MHAQETDDEGKALVVRAASVGAAHVHLRGESKQELAAGDAIAMISGWPHWRCMFQAVEGESDVGHWAVWHVDADGGSMSEAMTFLSVSAAVVERLSAVEQ